MPDVELQHCSQNEWRGKRVPRKLKALPRSPKIPASISVSKPGTNEAELGLHPNHRDNDFLPDQSSEVGKVSRVRHMVPGGSRESLPKRKVRFADKNEAAGAADAGWCHNWVVWGLQSALKSAFF